MGKPKLTKLQRDVMARLAIGQRQFREGKEVKRVTYESLYKRKLVHYCSSGGWTSISPWDEEPEEPGVHLLKIDLSTIVEALKANGEPVKSHWFLLDMVKPFGMNFHAMDAALRYGERMGVIVREDWSIRLTDKA